jgi:hypothetical protein
MSMQVQNHSSQAANAAKQTSKDGNQSTDTIDKEEIIKTIMELLQRLLNSSKKSDEGNADNAAKPAGGSKPAQGGNCQGRGGQPPAGDGGKTGDGKGQGGADSSGKTDSSNAKVGNASAGHAEVDVNGDGKNDIAYNGANAEKFAAQTAKDAKAHPKYAEEILDNAKASPTGMAEVAIKDPSQMSISGAAGVAPVGQQGIGKMQYGKHEMASDTTPENQMAVEAHEMQHNNGHNHGGAMDAAVNEITRSRAPAA